MTSDAGDDEKNISINDYAVMLMKTKWLGP